MCLLINCIGRYLNKCSANNIKYGTHQLEEITIDFEVIYK